MYLLRDTVNTWGCFVHSYTNIHSLLVAHFSPTPSWPCRVLWRCDTRPPRLLILTSCLIGGLAMEEKRLNAFAQNAPLIFPNSSAFINHAVHERKKTQFLTRSPSFHKYATETCCISNLNPTDSSWITVYRTETCQRAIKEVLQHNFLYFPPDDDLGKSDSSSGSMDSFQVGPTSSAGCSHIRYIITWRELQH